MALSGGDWAPMRDLPAAPGQWPLLVGLFRQERTLLWHQQPQV